MEHGCAATACGKRLTALDGSASSLSQRVFLERHRSSAFQQKGILNSQTGVDAEFLRRERTV